MTPSRLAEIRARATETRHPLDLGHMYQRDVKELLEELAVERRASDLLCAASQKAVAAEREACAKVADFAGDGEAALAQHLEHTHGALVARAIANKIRERG